MNADEPLTPPQPGTATIVVWDLPIRLFHWLTVVLVAAAYTTAKLNWLDWHARVGETLLALLLFRLLWGCFGSDTARFRRFVVSPATALHHLRRLLRREPDQQIGHNPAGGWMVLLLLALLLGETLTGLYINNDIADAGPLTPWVPAVIANAITALHAIFWDALWVAVALHLSAIAVYALAKGHYLLRPMVTGRKHFAAPVRVPQMAPPLRALLLLALAAIVVVLLVAYL